MCPHVLCLSLMAPPPTPFFLHINWLYSLSPLLSSLPLPLSGLLLHSFVESQANYQFLLQYNFPLSPQHLHFCCYPLRTMKARRKMYGSSSSSSSLKCEFLKKWITGLQICRNTKRNTDSIQERKNAIKLSADVAIAATRSGATRWRRAALRDVVSRDRTNGALIERILGQGVLEDSRTIACSRRIVRRSRNRCRRRGRGVVPKSSWNRRRALERVVPGGEGMDGASLLRETLDYIVALRAQVDVMRLVAEAAARR